jgi:DNA-damage-inducible protein J
MNTVVRARISEEVKNEVAAILEAMGLTVSDAFRIMMTRIAREHALPLEPLVPNEETIAAMRAVRQGKTETVTIDQLQTVLDADDPPVSG